MGDAHGEPAGQEDGLDGLTKNMVKDAIASALTEYQAAETAKLSGGSLGWTEIGEMSGYGWCDSTRGARFRVLSIEELEHAIFSV